MEDQQRKRFVRFAITGLGATLIHVLVASFLIELHSFKSHTANGCAFILATCFSYFFNTYWSFSLGPNVKNAYRFWVTSVIGFIMAVSLGALADALSVHYLIGIAMIVVSVPLVSFFIHSKWTFS